MATGGGGGGGLCSGRGGSIPIYLFFSILKPVPFKKLNGQVGGDEKILKSAPFAFDFCFYFKFFKFIFLLY